MHDVTFSLPRDVFILPLTGVLVTFLKTWFLCVFYPYSVDTFPWLILTSGTCLVWGSLTTMPSLVVCPSCEELGARDLLLPRTYSGFVYYTQTPPRSQNEVSLAAVASWRPGRQPSWVAPGCSADRKLLHVHSKAEGEGWSWWAFCCLRLGSEATNVSEEVFES